MRALGIYLQEQGELDGGPESLERVQDWLNGVLEKVSSMLFLKSRNFGHPNIFLSVHQMAA